MGYQNIVLILKQVSSGYSNAGKSVGGISRVEIESGVPCAFISIINAKVVDKGEYFCYILDGKKYHFYTSLRRSPYFLS